MYKYKSKRCCKIIKNRTGKDCPLCGHPLVRRVNTKTKQIFIGCSNFPTCCFIQAKTVVDYACEALGVEWRPNIQEEAVYLFDEIVKRKFGSRDEVKYVLGAAYYLDHLFETYENANGIELVKMKVQHNDDFYNGVGFLEPFAFWGGGIAPSAMAFVPQVKFGQKLHHDFGIFFSGNHSASFTEWYLGCAIEIDVHPHHRINPGEDNFRDSLVNYPVLRLHPATDSQLEWFRKVKGLYENLILSG